jgi:threonine dehydratase
MEKKMINKESIILANERVRPYIRKTPLEYSKALSDITQSGVFLKMENLQHTGSFKPRGAFNCLLNLDLTRYNGIIAPTAGNHGIGLAYAANKLNIPVHVYIPKDTDSYKIDILLSFNARIKMFTSFEAAHFASLKAAKSEKLKFLSAYNNKCMINGGGTVGIEIVEDLNGIDIVMVPVGGGGLIAGISKYIKAINPGIQIWGVQTKNSPTFAKWFRAKKVIPVRIKRSIAAGLSGMVEDDVITFPIIKENIDRFIELSEEELIKGMKFMGKNHKQIVEPSGVAAISALMQKHSDLSSKKIVAVVTGQNISPYGFNNLVGQHSHNPNNKTIQ